MEPHGSGLQFRDNDKPTHKVIAYSLGAFMIQTSVTKEGLSLLKKAISRSAYASLEKTLRALASATDLEERLTTRVYAQTFFSAALERSLTRSCYGEVRGVRDLEVQMQLVLLLRALFRDNSLLSEFLREKEDDLFQLLEQLLLIRARRQAPAAR